MFTQVILPSKASLNPRGALVSIYKALRAKMQGSIFVAEGDTVCALVLGPTAPEAREALNVPLNHWNTFSWRPDWLCYWGLRTSLIFVAIGDVSSDAVATIHWGPVMCWSLRKLLRNKRWGLRAWTLEPACLGSHQLYLTSPSLSSLICRNGADPELD